MQPDDTVILLVHCPDRKGLIASITDWIFRHNGNVVNLDQHVDAAKGVFFMRIEWSLAGFALPQDDIAPAFRTAVAERLGLQWSLHFSYERLRMAVFVSKLSHCLWDILARCQAGEWKVSVPLVISNHNLLESAARQFGSEYHVFSINRDNKAAQEQAQLDLLQRHQIDVIVLARYMQILSDDFIARYPNRIINIHHSFLPAFAGAKPYRRAYERGVKIIGATAHYVTADLDEGPIIEQDVVRVSHKDAVEDLIRKGQDLEKIVLARAVWSHLSRQIVVYDNRTVVFG